MKLTLATPFRSIYNFESAELPDFVVITGINGTGKSHLLEAIEQGAIAIDQIEKSSLQKLIRRFDWTNLIPNHANPYSPTQIVIEHEALWQKFQHIKQDRLKRLDAKIREIYPRLHNMPLEDFLEINPDVLNSNGVLERDIPGLITSIDKLIEEIEDELKKAYFQKDDEKFAIRYIRQKYSGRLIALDKKQFIDALPVEWQQVHMFGHSFTRLFARYQELWLENDYKRYRNTRGENLSTLDDEQFVARHGEPPWEVVNNILKIAGLNFFIRPPEKFEKQVYEAMLTDTRNNHSIRFNELSSGEKIIMSFALCLYYANNNTHLIDPPSVLLLDEIDAPLHPQMIQSVLRIIETVLVKQHKIKVILTTHSASTVALAPESSLYAMTLTDKGHQLINATKDRAISILTAGVPTLSVDYDNRRQVFVESHHDAIFYEKLYEKTKKYIKPTVSLSFIAASRNNAGGCNLVTSIVSQLHRAGNDRVFGIIDWDGKNVGDQHVIVLGKDKRHSIESYLLDPLLVAALLLRERFITRADLGVEEIETHVDLGKLSSDRLQVAANYVLDRISDGSLDSDNKVRCTYAGGRSIDIPESILKMRGHDLEECLKRIFPKLRDFHQPPDLKNAIINLVIDDIPSLTPKCFIELFEQIQT